MGYGRTMLLLCCWLAGGVREAAVQQLVGGTKKPGNVTTTSEGQSLKNPTVTSAMDSEGQDLKNPTATGRKEGVRGMSKSCASRAERRGTQVSPNPAPLQ